MLIPEDKISELKKLCIEKINNGKYNLLKEDDAIYILFRWRDWSSNLEEYKNYLDFVYNNEEMFLQFLRKFEYNTHSHDKGFNYDNLKEFYTIDDTREKLLLFKKSEGLYTKWKSIIDNFLDNIK